MKTAFFIILALVALAALGRWMLLMLIDGLSGIAGEHGDDDRTEGKAKSDAQITREIEQWRDGK